MVRLIPMLMLVTACGGTEATAPGPAPDVVALLPAEGERYDPAVDPAEVPDGAWMCDMGTVHYAANQAGECPVCGMKLVQKK